MILSILIPLTKSRRQIFKALHASLKYQALGKSVEIILNWEEEHNVGKKRNDLLNQASGEWSWFIDSDDMIADDSVERILKALESNPDCLGISGYMTTNGERLRAWKISKDYGSWYERKGVYYRTTNHISPFRTSLGIQAGFPEIRHGEDAIFSARLLPLLKSEIIIPGDLYHYRYRNDEEK